MRTRARHNLGAALLALLIAASFVTTGGWFCADGRACLPALSPTCCCGGEAEQSVAAAGGLCEGESCHPRLREGDCGCYQDLTTVAAAARTERFALHGQASLHHPDLTPPAPPSGWLPGYTPADPLPPPRFLISPGDTRAPPAV